MNVVTNIFYLINYILLGILLQVVTPNQRDLHTDESHIVYK